MASLSCAGYRHDGRTAFRIQQILSHPAIIYSAGGATAPPAGKWTSGHYDAYNRQHTTTDHYRCLLHHAAPQRLRHGGQHPEYYERRHGHEVLRLHECLVAGSAHERDGERHDQGRPV